MLVRSSYRHLPVALAAAAALSLALTSGCNERKESTSTPASLSSIKIGVISSLSGRFTPFAEPVQNGLRQAVDEINASGGLRGRKIELITEDDQSDTQVGIKAFEKLVQQDHVLAIIGPTSSDGTLATAPLAERFHIAQIVPSAHDSALRNAGANTFTVFPTTEEASRAAATYAIETKRPKRVAILYPNTKYGQDATGAYLAKFKEANVEVVSVQTFEEGQTDFSAAIQKVVQAKPDTLFAPSYYKEESAAIIKQLYEAQNAGARAIATNSITPMLVGQLCEELPEAVSGPAGQNVTFIDEAPARMETASAGFRAFNKAFSQKFNMAPTPYAASAHASVFTLVAALEKAKFNPAQVSTALRSLELDTAAFGHMKFQGNANVGTTFAAFKLDGTGALRAISM